ncbi:hypothetical protein HNQ86_000837 [Oleiagrimonas soli]|uniref:Uncharacterized protein n=1 Tax=Oleiagrimonas soli TaxID=1543381 RepID=A0A841KE72_9GAMM|nr:hypothetical protein [Oleiagrimonas soli]
MKHAISRRDTRHRAPSSEHVSRRIPDHAASDARSHRPTDADVCALLQNVIADALRIAMSLLGTRKLLCMG